jgi:hypothetical protein
VISNPQSPKARDSRLIGITSVKDDATEVIFHDLQQFEIKRGTKMVNFKDGKKRK